MQCSNHWATETLIIIIIIIIISNFENNFSIFIYIYIYIYLFWKQENIFENTFQDSLINRNINSFIHLLHLLNTYFLCYLMNAE